MTDPIEPTPEDTATWSQEPEPEPLPQGEEDSDAPDDAELDDRTRAYVAKLKREAQGLRTKLRDAEEIAGAAAARETVHTREAVAAAAAQAGLIDGNDLFIAHPDPDPFLDEFHEVVGRQGRRGRGGTAGTQTVLGQDPRHATDTAAG